MLKIRRDTHAVTRKVEGAGGRQKGWVVDDVFETTALFEGGSSSDA